jgi:acyl homoserine lactone synthase
MLCYLYADELNKYPKLQDSMFKDRAAQFGERLKWDVSIDHNGYERDEYDALNPMYAIWRRTNGQHGGSMRILPTTGPCMVNDHFSDVAGGTICSPLIWESTRFCLSPDVGDQAARISAAIMLAGCEVGLRFHLSHAVGVFDPRITRIYSALGWSPEIIGQSGSGRTKVQVGLWEFSQDVRAQLCQKSRIAPDLSSLWINQAFSVETGQAQSA